MPAAASMHAKHTEAVEFVPLTIVQGEAVVSRDSERPIAAIFGEYFASLTLTDVPPETLVSARRCLLDVSGVTVASRHQDYVHSAVRGWDGEGRSTALGHSAPLDASGAAFVNGIAAHGEDFDDTYEGSPMRAGACVVPAVLALCERHALDGERLVLGVVAGLEASYRFHRATAGLLGKRGFHHVGVVGALGAAVGASVSMELSSHELTMAIGIAASMASGIAEWRLKREWTKRLHPGWAAQSGYRAASLASAGFRGPDTAIEGQNGWLRSFAGVEGNGRELLTPELGQHWFMDEIVFKPYACATMIHPYIDCVLALRSRGVATDDILRLECLTSPAIVPMLWEPLEDRRSPATTYGAKFSMPFALAAAMTTGGAGLATFTDEILKDEATLSLAARIEYIADDNNDFPENYSGHARAILHNGEVIEVRQPHMRGGKREPMTQADLETKFGENLRFGHVSEEASAWLLDFVSNIDQERDVSRLGGFRAMV